MNDKFEEEREKNIANLGSQIELRKQAVDFISNSAVFNYSYHFDWFGRPIIQFPQDIVAIQEIIWKVRPDLIIETGIARGGSLVFSASMLAMLDLCDSIVEGVKLEPVISNRKVLGVDIEIRSHNLEAIKKHPMSSRIELIEGSSIDKNIFDKVKEFSENYSKILVILDSNHTKEHVYKELIYYSTLVSIDSYCIVLDTVIDDMPSDLFMNKPWSNGNSPKTAVREFLKTNQNFIIDSRIDNKLLISSGPQGYLYKLR